MMALSIISFTLAHHMREFLLLKMVFNVHEQEFYHLALNPNRLTHDLELLSIVDTNSRIYICKL